MTALTPSHKRIRVMMDSEERESEGEISDEYEDADALGKKQTTVVEESFCRKRKRDLTNDVQLKSMKTEAVPLNEEELLLIEEEIGFDEKKINKQEEESISAKVGDNLDEDEQDSVKKEDQRMLKKMVDHKEKPLHKNSQKLQDEEQTTFEEEEILEEEDEMLAYLWPGSGRRSVF